MITKSSVTALVWGVHPVEDVPHVGYIVPCQTRCTGVPSIQCGACTLWRIHLNYDTLYLVRLDAQVCHAYSVEHAPCGEYTSVMIHCTLSDSMYMCSGLTVWGMHPVENTPQLWYTVPCQTRCTRRIHLNYDTLYLVRLDVQVGPGGHIQLCKLCGVQGVAGAVADGDGGRVIHCHDSHQVANRTFRRAKQHSTALQVYDFQYYRFLFRTQTSYCITCGPKSRDVTPRIAWRKETLKVKAFDDYPREGEKRPSSCKRTNCFKDN